MNKGRLENELFWAHFVILLVWLGLFLVPSSLWNGKVPFHFWYIMVIIILEVTMGLLMLPFIHTFRLICPLTTATELVRGHKLTDPESYDHSFTVEFAQKTGMKLNNKLVNEIIFLSLIVVSVQYYFYLF